MIYKRNLLYKRQSDMMKIDQRICELQTRLSRKRQLNQQLSNSQTPNGGILRDSSNDPLYSPKSFLRSSIGPSGYIKVPSYSRNHHLMTNIATVEPIPRYKANIMEVRFPHITETLSGLLYFSMLSIRAAATCHEFMLGDQSRRKKAAGNIASLSIKPHTVDRGISLPLFFSESIKVSVLLNGFSSSLSLSLSV